jgi:hypothetical protein
MIAPNANGLPPERPSAHLPLLLAPGSQKEPGGAELGIPRRRKDEA